MASYQDTISSGQSILSSQSSQSNVYNEVFKNKTKIEMEYFFHNKNIRRTVQPYRWQQSKCTKCDDNYKGHLMKYTTKVCSSNL